MSLIPVKDPTDAIIAALQPLEGARILDIGCGRGALAKALSMRGVDVVGVDPESAALMVAKREAPEAAYVRAKAEVLPFKDASFDGAVFQNSLHHVPVPMMQIALRAAVRAIRGGNPLVVVEPLAAGSLFEMVKPIEDETDVRAAAREALRAVARDASIQLDERETFLRVSTFASFEAAMATIVAVDPNRALVARRHQDELKKHFFRLAVPTEAGFRFEQPMLTCILAAKPGRGED